MKKFSINALLVFVGLIVGCSGGAINVGPYAVSCNDWDQLKPSDQEAIKSSALDVLKKLSKGETKEVLENSHPLFKNSATQEQFDKAVENIRPRLTQADRANLIDGRLLTLTSVTNQSVDTVCGVVDPNAPAYLKVRAFSSGSGVQKVAITMFEIPSQPLKWVASLQMSEQEGRYKFVRIDINTAGYNGKDSHYYARIAEGWFTNKRLFPAYVAFSMALNLSQRGSTLQTSAQIKYSGRVADLEKNDDVKSELKTWKVEDINYEIYRIGLIETLNDVSIWVHYISRQPLGETTTTKEASKLMEYLKQKYPELAEEFEFVVFQAFSEPPNDPNRQYEYYRVPLRFRAPN